MKYEIRLSAVPDGARTEDYLGHDRNVDTLRDAKRIVAQFNRAKRCAPQNFEPGMRAEIITLR